MNFTSERHIVLKCSNHIISLNKIWGATLSINVLKMWNYFQASEISLSTLKSKMSFQVECIFQQSCFSLTSFFSSLLIQSCDNKIIVFKWLFPIQSWNQLKNVMMRIINWCYCFRNQHWQCIFSFRFSLQLFNAYECMHLYGILDLRNPIN